MAVPNQIFTDWGPNELISSYRLNLMKNSVATLDGATFTGNIVAPLLRTNAGTESAPDFSFSTDSDTGMFRSGVNVLGFSTGGTKRVEISASSINSSIAIRTSIGSATAPSFSYWNDSNTGLFFSAADTLAVTTGGTKRLEVSNTALSSVVPLRVGNGSTSAPSFSFTGDTNTGIYSDSADRIGFVTGGTHRLSIANDGIDCLIPVLMQPGSAAAPMYSFFGDTDTGIYAPAANTLGLSTNGAKRLEVSTSAVNTTVPVRVSNGSAGTPSLAFESDSDTGIFRAGANSVSLSAGGLPQLNVMVDENQFGYVSMPTGAIFYSGNTRPQISTGNDSGFEINGFGGILLSTAGSAPIEAKRASSTGKIMGIWYNTTEVGSISTNGTNTAFNTSSDVSLKTNIHDASYSPNKIPAIQIREFTWKSTGEEALGVVAQELNEIAPEAVTTGDLWQVDYSKLVPALIQEVQELRKRLDAIASE